jgi:hypothetical protein
LASSTLSLPALLEARSAAPADVSPDGRMVLVLSNLGGTMQVYRLPSTVSRLRAAISSS